ncbi:MAG: hypothetical protein F4Y02_01520 [Chloroflexi bacterium]|nr:hypothetical protein [Chloroflexota bacterium]
MTRRDEIRCKMRSPTEASAFPEDSEGGTTEQMAAPNQRRQPPTLDCGDLALDSHHGEAR